MILKFLVKNLVIFFVFISLAPWSFNQVSSASPVEINSETIKFNQLLDDIWQWQLETDPVFATEIGDKRYDHLWQDFSLITIKSKKRQEKQFYQQLQALKMDKLDVDTRLGYQFLSHYLENSIAQHDFPEELLPFDHLDGGAHVLVPYVISIMPTENLESYDNIMKRFHAIPTLIAQQTELMKLGIKQDVVLPTIIVNKVIRKLDDLINTNHQDSPILSPFRKFPDSLTKQQQKQLQTTADNIYQQQIIPAYKKLLNFFKSEYLPHTRETVGLFALSNGKAWYAQRVKQYTTTDLTAQEIHRIGLTEVRRIRGHMDDVITQVGFKGSFAEFGQFLLNDPQFFYDTAADLIRGYRDIAKQADAESIKLFGRLPRLPYGVVPVPAYREKTETTARYIPGSAKMARAGFFWANTYDLNSRPKWEMEALTLHEAIPGHHLQIALSQEMEQVHDFFKHSHFTVFTEGWGLYAEYLGEEMGFYQDPYAKFGQLAYEMWRAIRLVVDTGIHHMGWSRQQAINYFQQNSIKAQHDIEVEIDRYIAWPGQALAYKIGELKIKELRQKAENKLGEKFNVREFHDALLTKGALPLILLEQQMDNWLVSKLDQ